MPRLGAQTASAESTPSERAWRPQLYRKCTDTAWLFLFFLFWTGLMFLMGYSAVAGSAGRLLFGYDSFGNVCGRKNAPVQGAPLSGQDMTLKKHVFFLNACNLDTNNVQLGSIVLCVTSCPEEQLDTLEEIQLFANSTGSFLCVYNLDSFNYTQNPEVDSLCPRLPVPPSKSFPLFNRCIPQTPECYSSFASVLINDLDTLHRILSGIMSGRDTILGLCLLALALSLAMMITFRFLTTLLVHIFIALIVFGLLFVCSILWWLYYDYTNDLSIELDTERENMKCLLGFALISTAITAVLLVLIFVLRKRIKLAVELFQVTNKAISSLPLLLFQPLWTFALLIFFWVLWLTVLLCLGTAGAAQVIEGGQVDYQPLSGIRYMWWYHLLGLIWTSEFILAGQQFTVAGAVATCYFNRNKNDPPNHPILSSLSILCCYHQGTLVKGSFLITVVRIPRIILLHIYNILKRKNAYTATAINGTDFCTSAKDALKLLSKNSSHFASVSCFGDFVIFLGKVLVVCFTVFGGLMAFNYHRALQLWAIPLLLVAFFAYLVAHSFLSVFETVLNVLFLCFAVDLETNDGSSEKPYFMDQEFLSFIKRIQKLNDVKAQCDKDLGRKDEGMELQPIVR